jgi:hypothetical protein
MDLKHLFTHHPPEGEADIAAYHAIRQAGLNLAEVIVANTVPSADQTAAVRKVREAVFTANAARALKGRGT